MPVFIMALGAAMLLGGVAAVALALPYVVLEAGFTQVIVGSVVATGGVVVLVGGLVLREMRRLAAGGIGGATAALPTAAAIGATSVAGAAAVALAAGEAPAGKDAELQPELPFGADAPAPAGKTAGSDGAQGQDEAAALVGEPVASEAASEPEAAEPHPEHGEPPELAPESAEEALKSLLTQSPIVIPAATDKLEDNLEALRKSLTGEVAATDVEEPSGAGEAAGDPPFIQEEPPNPADRAEAIPAQPAPEPAPAVSEEGIVSVKRVGDATYTMFADGAVRAESPAGARRFTSLDELKRHLASGKPLV